MLMNELNKIGYICSRDDVNLLKKFYFLKAQYAFAVPVDINGLLQIDEDEFTTIPGIGKKYQYLLKNLKVSVRNFIGVNGKNKYEDISISQIRDFANDIKIFFDETLNTILLKNINNLEDLLNLKDDILEEFFVKNSTDRQIFINFRTFLASYFDSTQVSKNKILEKKFHNLLLGSYCLNFSDLSSQQQSLILYLEDKLGIMTLQDIVNLEGFYLAELNLSRAKLNTYEEVLKKIGNLSSSITENEQLHNSISCLYSSKIDFRDLEKTIIADLDSFLLSLDNDNRYIALSRLGYVEEEKSLEQIGFKLGLTREAIRQKETDIYICLRHSLRIHPRSISDKIDESFENLNHIFPNLSKLFSKNKLFYKFIEIIAEKAKGYITKQIFPDYKNNILDEFFVVNPSPVSKDLVINFLITEYGYSNISSIAILNGLESKHIIKVTDHGITPIALTQSCAVAHALTAHPKGLPWGDVCEIVNKNSFSQNKLDEKRATHGFKQSDYVYLYGRGVYRNLMFSGFENIEYEKILVDLREKLKKLKVDKINLYGFFNDHLDKEMINDYYAFRYLVSKYGEEFGLYFSGRSSSDILSIGQRETSHSQENNILEVLKRTNNFLNASELATHIMSKSKHHVNLYLHNLLKEEKIVRVDRASYTTPENAFKGIETDMVFSEIKSILSSTDKIIELDVLREKINRKLNYSFSKYYYGSLISCHNKTVANLSGIFKRNNFISKRSFTFRTFSDLIDAFTFNNKVMFIEELIEKIKGVVLITSRVEDMVKNNLRNVYHLEYKPRN